MIPNNILNMIRQFNPDIPFNNIKTPDDLAQFLLNTGRVNQSQVNQAKQMWNRQDIRQMIQSKFPL